MYSMVLEEEMAAVVVVDLDAVVVVMVAVW